MVPRRERSGRKPGWRTAVVLLVVLAVLAWFVAYMHWLPPRAEEGAPLGAGEKIHQPAPEPLEEDLER